MSASDDRNDAQNIPHYRRASFSPGTSLSELFTGRSAPVPYPGPNAAAAQRNRRVSISGTSPTGGQPMSSLRRGSVSSISSSASGLDEGAIDEVDSVPANPFVRRMSFGARALRDFRMPVSRISQPHSPVSSPSVRGGQWIEPPKSNSPPLPHPGENPHHQRRPSLSTMPLPVTVTKQALEDPLQERILKGDFYMD